MNRTPSSSLPGTFYRSSINRRVFQKMENNIGIFYSQKTFFRSPMDRRTCSGLLWTETINRSSLIYEILQILLGQVFYRQDEKVIRYPMTKGILKVQRLLTGSAWNEELVHVFYEPTTFYSRLWTKDLLQVFYGQRPWTGLPWTAVSF